MSTESSHSKLKPLDEVVEKFSDSCTLMCGGFGGVGSPPLLIDALKRRGTRNISLICNDAGFPDVGIGLVICAGQIKKLTATHIGSNPVAGRMMSSGELKVDFIPQGTFAEQVRAGGCGLGGVLVDDGLEKINGREYPMIESCGKFYRAAPALRAEVGIIYAKRADHFGNLFFEAAGRNTNPLMAMASDFTIVQAEEIVESIPPHEVMLPGIFVDALVCGRGGEWSWPWE